MGSKALLGVVLALSLASCAGGAGGGGGYGFSGYSLVQVKPRQVANRTMTVTPKREYNRIPRGFYDIREEENWTLNGPILDSISFVGGLKDGKAIVRQRKKDDRQVPVFRANMTPPEIVSMIESLYRIRAGAAEFGTTGLKPATFLGRPGFQLDYDYLDTNEIKRRGRSYGAVVNGELYMMLLDAARSNYFGAAVADFDAMARGAALRR